MSQGDTQGLARAVASLTTADIGGRAAIDSIVQGLSSSENEPDTPKAMTAANALSEQVDSGDTVIVLTGFPIPPTMIPETDGPPGAVSISRAIDQGLDGNVLLACDPGAVEICTATARAGGLSVLERKRAFESSRTIAIEAFPTTLEDAATYADEILDLDPAAVVAVEKVGPNKEGVYHNMAGHDVSDATAKVGELFDRINSSLTVSVGDGGNEIGMGTIEATVRDEIGYGDQCHCACGAGIACSIETDILVPAAVSNWGAHAIVTCLSIILNTPLLHTPEIERRMLVEASLNGAIDGTSGRTNGWCDGLPTVIHESMVQLLAEVPDAPVHDHGGGKLGR